MQILRLLRISCLAVVVSLILLERAGAVLGQEFSVTPSDRVTRFVNVREEPSADSDRLARLHPGERLPLIESVPRWHEVRLDDGRSGFVSKAWTVVVPGPPPESDEELRIHVLSVGAGTCTVVECPGPGAPPMIVDCGSSGGGEMAIGQDAARHKVGEILSRHAAAPNLVLSHGDIDHYNWAPIVLEGVTVQNIWQGGESDSYASGIFPAWLKAQEDLGAVVHRDYLRKGDAVGQHRLAEQLVGISHDVGGVEQVVVRQIANRGAMLVRGERTLPERRLVQALLDQTKRVAPLGLSSDTGK